ncbi:hypothetical protein FA15DRAFT_679241 [Coprinopsis marcescibilis]|uniref:RRM domain-containing protein n=1 Tax=Coprinopsis marcescibilis TaxID=230819 RepID=A0A5C3L4H9_COPMA|nr:hypothetical protein FA15DRAFT_679241 [Coprinopsis marcescibilis]
MDVDSKPSNDKPGAKVIIVNNLTRNVAEIHLRTIFGFYGEISKIDLPLYGKSGQNKGKAALEFADASSAHRAASHMDGGQLDGAALKVELSDLPIRNRSRSPLRRAVRNGRNRSYSRSRSRTRSLSRSRSPSRSRTRSRSPPYRRAGGYGGRDYRGGRGGGGAGRRGGPPGRNEYRPVNRSRSRSPIRRGGDLTRAPPRRRSPSYTRGGLGRGRRPRSRTVSKSRSYSIHSSRSRTRSYSRSRSRSYSSDSRGRSRTRSRSGSRGRRSSRSSSRDDIRDSRSRSPRPA